MPFLITGYISYTITPGNHNTNLNDAHEIPMTADLPGNPFVLQKVSETSCKETQARCSVDTQK